MQLGWGGSGNDPVAQIVTHLCLYKSIPKLSWCVRQQTQHNKCHLQLAPFASHAYWLINIYNLTMTGIFWAIYCGHYRDHKYTSVHYFRRLHVHNSMFIQCQCKYTSVHYLRMLHVHNSMFTLNVPIFSPFMW
jgi:hypothetical protein